METNYIITYKPAADVIKLVIFQGQYETRQHWRTN